MIFLYPYLLFFGIASLIPIIFHIIKKIRRKKFHFPYIFLFKNEIKGASRSNKFKELLLLLIRILIIILVIILFSRPVISKNTNQVKLVNLFIDNTKSMLYRYNDKILLTQMKNKLKKYVANFNDKTIFNVAFSNGKILKNIDKRTLVNILTNLKTSKYIITPVEAKKRLFRISKRVSEKIFIICSDFRQNRYKHYNFTNNERYILIGPRNRRNVEITQISYFKRLLFHGERININFVLKNYSGINEKIILRLFNKNKIVYKKSYSLSAGEKKHSSVQVLLNHQKTNFRFQITSDNFPYDDIFNFTIPILKKLSILILSDSKLEKQLIKKSLFIKSFIEKNNIQIHFKKRYSKYDIVILSKVNFEYVKGKICTIIIPKSLKINSFNKLLQRYTDAVKFKKIVRKKIKLKNDNYFPVVLDVSDVFLKSYYSVEAFLKGYFSINNGKFIYTTDNLVIFTSNINFNNSNILYLAKLPVILNRLLYNSVNKENKRVNKFKYNENNVKNIFIPDKYVLIKGNKERLNKVFQYVIFVILLLLICFELFLSFRSNSVTENRISK